MSLYDMFVVVFEYVLVPRSLPYGWTGLPPSLFLKAKTVCRSAPPGRSAARFCVMNREKVFAIAIEELMCDFVEEHFMHKS